MSEYDETHCEICKATVPLDDGYYCSMCGLLLCEKCDAFVDDDVFCPDCLAFRERQKKERPRCLN